VVRRRSPVPLPGKARLGLLLTNLAAVLVVMFRPVAQVLRREVNWIDATDQIETHNPRFAERLQTITSQLLSTPQVRGSPEILDSIIADVNW